MHQISYPNWPDKHRVPTAFQALDEPLLPIREQG